MAQSGAVRASALPEGECFLVEVSGEDVGLAYVRGYDYLFQTGHPALLSMNDQVYPTIARITRLAKALLSEAGPLAAAGCITGAGQVHSLRSISTRCSSVTSPIFLITFDFMLNSKIVSTPGSNKDVEKMCLASFSVVAAA